MGRPRKSQVLSVWMNGERVGDWRRPGGKRQEFLYAESWFNSPAARPISLSLPLRPSREPYREGVESFFENLLPDNRQIRERIQRRFRTDSMDAFELLSEIGRDCVGALQLMPEGQMPMNVRQITAESLTTEGVAGILSRTLGDTFAREEGFDDTFRISLAGAQEKTALFFRNGVWHRPIQTTPSTHILKLPLGVNSQGIDLTTSVENEWLCSQVVRAYGIEVAECWMATFAEYKVLVVERFDRRAASDGSWYIRLPQEDFCQATGTSPGLKYENDGGPGIARVMEILLGSDQAEKDRRNFMRTQLIFWLLAAIDGHAKNFSVFLLPGGAYRLTPCYDILSAYPVLGHGRGKYEPQKIKMAMAVEGKNRHYRWSEIRARHWIEMSRRCGFSEMPSVMQDVIAATPGVLEQLRNLIPAGFSEPMAAAIFDGIQAAARQLESEFLS